MLLNPMYAWNSVIEDFQLKKKQLTLIDKYVCNYINLLSKVN